MSDEPEKIITGFEASMRSLPEEERQKWKEMADLYIATINRTLPESSFPTRGIIFDTPLYAERRTTFNPRTIPRQHVT